MTEREPELPGEAVAKVLGHLIQVYGRDGTFGSWCEILPGRDPRFTKRDWCRAFMRIPRMRKELFLGMLWSSFSGRVRSAGHSHIFTPGKRFNFSHRSFCDLLIFEAMLDVSAHFEASAPDLRPHAEGCIDLARRNARRIASDGVEADLYSYFPSRDHLIDRASPAWKWFLSIDAAVPDNDSSSIVLSSLLGLGQRLGAGGQGGPDGEENLHAFLGILESHQYGLGRHGQGSLSYENGVDAKDHGVVTWLFDRHNELDPTSNINILHFLATLNGIDVGLRDRARALARSILAFLGRRADEAEFLSGRMQQYYPVGSVYYFWYRFIAALEALPVATRAELDPDGEAGRISRLMRREAPGLFGCSGHANPGDLLMASPFLAKHGLMEDTLAGRRSSREWIGHFTSHHYETFHLLYPVKMICIARNLPLAAYLYSIMESDLYHGVRQAV